MGSYLRAHFDLKKKNFNFLFFNLKCKKIVVKSIKNINELKQDGVHLTTPRFSQIQYTDLRVVTQHLLNETFINGLKEPNDLTLFPFPAIGKIQCINLYQLTLKVFEFLLLQG